MLEVEVSPTSVDVCAVQPLREKTQPPETWVPSRTNSELRQEQLADPSLAKVINWKETSSTRPQWSHFSSENSAVKAYWSQWDRLDVRDAVLSRRWESIAGDTINGSSLYQRT